MKTTCDVGDTVKVTSGIYKDAEGAVADIQPECSVMRIETPEGAAYAFLESIQKVNKAFTSGKKPLRR